MSEKVPGTKRRMKAHYGNGKSRQLFNRAIRAEIPGGGKFLALMELVHLMRDRAQGGEELERLITIEDKLQDIRDEMTVDIREYWEERTLASDSADED